MKYIFTYIVILFIIQSSSFAQIGNLIPNASFELGPDSTSIDWVMDLDTIDGGCGSSIPVNGPDSWVRDTIYSGPDRILQVDNICNFDVDTAQSGRAWVEFGYIDAGKATLISPMQQDSIYHLSCYLSLEKFRGLATGSSQHIQIIFNGGDTITFYCTVPHQWIYFDTVFTASQNATVIEIIGGGTQFTDTEVKIDNMSLTKVDVLTAMDIKDKKNIKIYPNPSDGILRVDGINDAVINIYNSLGQQMNYTFLNEEHNILDLSNLPKGFYIIQIKTKQTIITQKILLTN